jgi:hypothetical protein
MIRFMEEMISNGRCRINAILLPARIMPACSLPLIALCVNSLLGFALFALRGRRAGEED